MVAQHAVGLGQVGGEQRPRADLQRPQLVRARVRAKRQPRGSPQRPAQPGAAADVDRRAVEHPAEGRVVDARQGEREAVEARTVDLDLHHEPPVEVVLAGDLVGPGEEVQAGLVLGHAPDALAALDRDLRGDGQVDDELARAPRPVQDRGRQRGRGARAVRAGDPHRELDVAADVRVLVVDDGDQQHADVAAQAQRMDLDARQQRRRPVRGDRECGQQRRAVARAHRQGERDAVDQRVAAAAALDPLRDPHARSSSASISGKTSRWAWVPMNMSRWP